MAATGFLAGGKCYPTADAARDAWFGGTVPAQTPGNPAYSGFYVKLSDGWHWRTFESVGGSMTLVSDVGPFGTALPSCDPSESFFDGMTLGWGVVAAMVVAWAVLQMKRQAK